LNVPAESFRAPLANCCRRNHLFVRQPTNERHVTFDIKDLGIPGWMCAVQIPPSALLNIMRGGRRWKSGLRPDAAVARARATQQHLEDSLAHEDTRTSIIGTVSADVMMLQLQASDALQEVLGAGRYGPDLLSRNREGIDMFLKLSKLVAQISQLHRKMLKDTETTAGQESEKMKN